MSVSSSLTGSAELNLPIDAMEKDSGLIATDWINFQGTNEYCDCGSLGMYSETSRQGKFNVFVKDEANGSVRVKVNTIYRQTWSWGNMSGTKDCVSTGALESKIHDGVKQRL